MRQPEFPLDPDLMAELEAIDATLSGRIVDPEFAELAELTVMVAAERPQLDPDRARSLDERVVGRFGPAAPRSSRRRAWRSPQWAAGLSVAAAAVVAVIVVGIPGGGSSGGSGGGASGGPGVTLGSSSSASGAFGGGTASSSAGKALPAKRSGLPRRAVAGTGQSLNAPAIHGASKGAPSTASGQIYGSATSSNGPAAAPSTPAPTPTARKVIQSAQLQLSAQGRWVDVVAQEVFDVVGQEKGIVRSSQVTAATGNGGYASFNLSIPSSNLADTVTRLSALAHSRVVSRTDGTEDVNGPYLSDQRHLADARALRASLLKQLARATTQAQIDSLQARIRTAEAQINSDQATLHRLEYQISFSQLGVMINGGPVPLPLASGTHSSGGFTIGHAAHDAVKVLTVAAGVALIALAALVPLGLLIALGVWIRLALSRRRREQALDAA